ncbi:MAG: efflux RND transporter periplasmic adaptor subunit [Nitrospirota bacterium]
MKKFWLIFGAIIIATLAYWGYAFYAEENGVLERVYEIERANLTEIITEVGTIVPIKEVDLTFPMTGKVAKIHVEEGDNVKVGDELAQLETSKLLADLNSANAAIQEVQASLNKLIAGATAEDLQIYETGVANAETNLEKQKIASATDIVEAEIGVEAKVTALERAIKENTVSLEQAYEDAIDTINDSNTRADASLGIINYIRDIYFSSGNNDSLQVTTKYLATKEDYDDLQGTLDGIDETAYATVDTALNEMREFLDNLAEVLSFVSDQLKDEPRVTVSVIDEGYVDTERTSISTAIANITSAKQTINSATEDTDYLYANGGVDAAQSALDQAEAALESVKAEWDAKISQAEGELQLTRDQLVQARAPAREEDIALYQAQLNQSIAYADLMQQTLNDTKLQAPLDGVITQIYTDIGELATVSTPVLSMITIERYKIEVYISELDIAQVELGDEVEVTFDAFGSDDMFMGKVMNINPFETVDDGDIFYEITIELDEEYDAVKSGMTVNISIKTADKENVLVAPSRYIGEENGGKYLKVLNPDGESGEEGEKYDRVEVVTGLKGRDMTEIVSGVEEGQEIIPYY